MIAPIQQTKPEYFLNVEGIAGVELIKQNSGGSMSNLNLKQTLEYLQGKGIPELHSHEGRVSEADTIQKLIDPLLEALGWNTKDYDSCKREYPHGTDNPVDIALFLGGNPVLLVEAKALGDSLDKRQYLTQTLNYANNANVRWCVLTNGVEWRVYNGHAQVQPQDKLFFKVRIDEDQIEKIVARLALIGCEGMTQGTIDQHWENWRIDQVVQEVIRKCCEIGNAALVSAVKKKDKEFKPKQIKDALCRAAKDMDFPNTDSFSGSVTAAIQPIHLNTTDMFEQDILKCGMVLRIRNEPDSEATVVDGKTVNYQGTKISYNQWGQKVKGWKTIQIYAHAETKDGQLLNDLRQGL